jgi:DNA-binding XRE family transcriptional regulator
MARELGVSRTTVRAVAREERNVSLAMEFRIGKWFQGQQEKRNVDVYNGIDALNRLSRANRLQLVKVKDRAVWESEKTKTARSYARNWRQAKKKGGKISTMSP